MGTEESRRQTIHLLKVHCRTRVPIEDYALFDAETFQHVRMSTTEPTRRACRHAWRREWGATEQNQRLSAVA